MLHLIVKEKKSSLFSNGMNLPIYYFSILNQSRGTNHAKEMVLVEEYGTYISKYLKLKLN
jgi:hypothetical protein